MTTIDLTSLERKQLESHGLTPEKAERQLNTFKNGIPAVHLIAPAKLNDGVHRFSEGEQEKWVKFYDENHPASIVKFIPASGAATRMFKPLFQFLRAVDSQEEEVEAILDKPEFSKLDNFFDHIQQFAFYPALKKHIPDLSSMSRGAYCLAIAQVLLEKEKLNYANAPKGLVPFHYYDDKTLTAFAEHFHEALNYCERKEGLHCHFTVGKQHLNKFQAALKHLRETENQAELSADFSFQDPSTDTIAVDLDNRPFVKENGELLIRPGGHGALLDNLNAIDADLIFIKNIDNVIVRRKANAMIFYKKMLAGVLLDVQKQVFALLRELDAEGVSDVLLEKANALIDEKLGIEKTLTNEDELRRYLNRPIRVCGMVENKGDPGGGPFWVKDGNNDVSLQIIEGAQMNTQDTEQNKIVNAASHFNPVDLVCGVKDYRGKKFDLKEFANPERAFITEKTKNGKHLKALELPGLWNGAMEYWNTVFVEIPAFTFNPVKSVVDLLADNHLQK